MSKRHKNHNFLATLQDDQVVYIRKVGEVLSSRSSGFSIDDKEYEEGIHCIGSPIGDYRNKVMAVVSASGCCRSIFRDRTEEIAGYVKKAAMDISQRIGYRADSQSAVRISGRRRTTGPVGSYRRHYRLRIRHRRKRGDGVMAVRHQFSLNIRSGIPTF